MTLTQTIPAMPVKDMTAAVEFYRDRLGFEVLHHDGGFAVLCRDEAVVHLWESSDEGFAVRHHAAVVHLLRAVGLRLRAGLLQFGIEAVAALIPTL